MFSIPFSATIFLGQQWNCSDFLDIFSFSDRINFSDCFPVSSVSTLAWKIPWREGPGRLQSMRLLRVGHDWATSLSLFTFMHWRGKWQPTPVFLPGESQGREPSGLLSMGSRRVGHDWRDLAVAVAVTQIVIIAFCANRTHERCMEGHWWLADQGMYSVSTPTDMLLFNSDTNHLEFLQTLQVKGHGPP